MRIVIGVGKMHGHFVFYIFYIRYIRSLDAFYFKKRKNIRNAICTIFIFGNCIDRNCYEVITILDNKYLKGSYTVEASIILSITFFVLAACIICTFYLHDRAVAQGASCEAAQTGSNFMKPEENRKAADAVKNKNTAERFMGSRNLTANVAIGEKEVTAVWQGTFPIPGFAAKYLFGNEQDIQKSWTCQKTDPADTIRKIRGLGALLTGGEK